MGGHGGLMHKSTRLLPMLHYRAPFSSAGFPFRSAVRAAATGFAMSTASDAADMAQQKRVLRSKIRKDLKALSPDQRALEDSAIQNFVLDSSWFKSCRGLCAYISCEALREVDTSRILAEVLRNPDEGHGTQVTKRLYVPRVEDKNSHMRMLSISNIEDLVANSMDILEPSPIDVEGNQREDVMQSSEPVDIFLVPGLAFDRLGRRLGRGGGKKARDGALRSVKERQWKNPEEEEPINEEVRDPGRRHAEYELEDLAVERKWKQPLLVALGYSVQIMEENVIPVTANDVLVDALVSPSGVTPISPAALERM